MGRVVITGTVREFFQLAFVVGGLWLAFHAFGALVLLATGNASPLAAAIFIDGAAGIGYGLWRLSKVLGRGKGA